MDSRIAVAVTGGAGFVGSNIAIWLKTTRPDWRIICLDNLKRRGSEIIINRLQSAGIDFIHCDVRLSDDLLSINVKLDWLIDCAAEPSVLAGGTGNSRYIIDNNLMGTVNCLELARQHNSRFIFISTSRIYPTELLNSINLEETDTRYSLSAKQTIPGVSIHGISERFPLDGVRSLYGSTKLSSELFIQEYGDIFGLQYIINRCGVITGPWQMGKEDQGVVTLWVARHYFHEPLSYIGWGGTGKQVRDILDIRDLTNLIDLQIKGFERHSNQIYNIGGGTQRSISLLELTEVCTKITGNRLSMKSNPRTRYADIKFYITDSSKISSLAGWVPKYSTFDTILSVFDWIRSNEKSVKNILCLNTRKTVLLP